MKRYLPLREAELVHRFHQQQMVHRSGEGITTDCMFRRTFR
jgi:hypothetical protein